MIRAIAIDDEPPALKVISTFCEKTDLVQLDKTFSRTDEALKYLKKFPVDLLFLDIHMPSLSGIEFYKAVKQDTMVIFTTAFSEYAVEGFNLNAIDFLLKPYSFERFMQAVEKAGAAYQHQRNLVPGEALSINIRTNYSLVKIAVADILYIEGLDDYVRFYMNNGKNHISRMTMKSLEAKLPADFVRIHRSYLVPLQKIEKVRNKQVIIGDRQLPIGKSYEKSFFGHFGTE